MSPTWFACGPGNTEKLGCDQYVLALLSIQQLVMRLCSVAREITSPSNRIIYHHSNLIECADIGQYFPSVALYCWWEYNQDIKQ